MVKICEPAIQDLLKALASTNVFFLRAPDNSAGPFIIIQRTDSTRWRAINNPSGIAQASIQVDAYDDTYLKAKTLGAAIEDILDGFRGIQFHGDVSPQVEFVDIAGISLQNDGDIIDDTEEPLLFRNSASYLVTYNQ